ncbi:MAG: endolytic transglycosylase MltG [Holosporaceae bacterium]|nr:MAG: endolytic transglycosylase MltG [Holosporaceae bacterium]
MKKHGIAASQGYFKTPEEMLIAASLIEKETFVKTERAVIAGVIVNRLKKGVRLQIDPSVIYGMTKTGLLGRPLNRQDLKK